MKKLVIITCLLLTTTIAIHAQQNDFPKLTGPYLGQKPPEKTPEIFASGIVSTDAHEFSCCFSPDGKEFYFTRRHPGLNENVIMYSKQINGFWTEPDIAPFVEKQFSFEPFITPDNKRLYFQTAGVVNGKPEMMTKYVERKEKGWGEVKDPGTPFNPGKTMHISVTLDGTIYTTDISGGMGSEALGIIKKVNGEYKQLEKLGLPFNNVEKGQHPWISPDESYMIFTVRRPGQNPVSVLFCSFRNKDGKWSDPIELKFGINAGLPFVSSNGKYLFFTSGEQGKSDIYWVSTKIIDELRPKE